MRYARPAMSSSRSQEQQPDRQRIAFGARTLEASLPVRKSGRPFDAVKPSFRQRASSILRTLPATPVMRRPMPTAETAMYPAGTYSGDPGVMRETRFDSPTPLHKKEPLGRSRRRSPCRCTCRSHATFTVDVAGRGNLPWAMAETSPSNGAGQQLYNHGKTAKKILTI
jgi:hypothetical protein